MVPMVHACYAVPSGMRIEDDVSDGIRSDDVMGWLNSGECK